MDDASKVIGTDIFGNRYYEIPADPSRGKRRGRRWFTSPTSGHHDPRNTEITQGFDSEIPSEWDSWLRFRRDMPPTEQQILQSYALAEMKKKNVADLERKRIEELTAEGSYVGPPKPMDHEKTFYPKYDEYEINPGEDKFERQKRWDDFKNPYLNSEEDTFTKKSKDSNK